MKIDHLMIGARDVNLSSAFYCDFLGFKKTDDDPGAAGGVVLTHAESEILILPFAPERLPNPFHFAFRVSTQKEFDRLLENAQNMNLRPRVAHSKKTPIGFGELIRNEKRLQIFYVSDPSEVSVEVMVAI